MDEINFSEISFHIMTARCYISEDGNIQNYRCENLKSYISRKRYRFSEFAPCISVVSGTEPFIKWTNTTQCQGSQEGTLPWWVLVSYLNRLQLNFRFKKLTPDFPTRLCPICKYRWMTCLPWWRYYYRGEALGRISDLKSQTFMEGEFGILGIRNFSQTGIFTKK
jgi:hypothetical protein